MGLFRILFLGDVVGPSSVEYIKSKLWNFRKSEKIDFTVINGENCAKGNGIDKAGASALFSGGADVITTGNHVFKRFETEELLEENSSLLRPGNYPPETPGSGSVLQNILGITVLTVNLLGLSDLEPLSCPFRCADSILEKYKGEYDISIVDFHAEATGEKAALGYYLDGRVTAVIGTHTHVTTADERILPNGSAFITDVGMCGPVQSALGVKPECIIQRLMSHKPVKFELSENRILASGIIIEADSSSGKALSVKRITF